MLEISLELAQVGLLRAARQLEKKGDAKARKLAKILRSAHAGIDAFLNDEEK